MELAHATFPFILVDLAKQLGDQGIRQLLTILATAYQDLYDRRWVGADSSEDSITEEWFVHILKRWRSENAFGLVPIHQKQDMQKEKSRGRPPTIDFCFRDEFFPDSYFGAECKLLDQGSSTHLKNYLDDKEGIGRFLSGKYAAHTGAGAMVGYVRRGDCNIVAQDVTDRLKKFKGNPNFKRSTPLPGFDQLYESKHRRNIGISPFICHHLLFAFKC